MNTLFRFIGPALLGVFVAVIMPLTAWSAAPSHSADGPAPLGQPSSDIQLLQPIGGVSSISPTAGPQVFFDYFNVVWPWLAGIAAGFGLLQAIVGGMQVMLSGGNKDAGVSRFMNALLGLLILGLADLILRTLNPLFFK